MTAVVDIVSTGVANTASVRAAFVRLGYTTRLAASAAAIRNARFLVLPGVGAFPAAIEQLQNAAWMHPLRERLSEGRPTLAICLGLQLLGTGSDEAPGVEGLGIVPARASRFADDDRDLRVPHMGFNRVVADPDCEILTSGDAYFAHSYRWDTLPANWHGATTEHGGPFVAAVERGRVLACQFHPELSASYGSDLLMRWLRRGGASC